MKDPILEQKSKQNNKTHKLETIHISNRSFQVSHLESVIPINSTKLELNQINQTKNKNWKLSNKGEGFEVGIPKQSKQVKQLDTTKFREQQTQKQQEEEAH